MRPISLASFGLSLWAKTVQSTDQAATVLGAGFYLGTSGDAPALNACSADT
jgi:hypothetical protein